MAQGPPDTKVTSRDLSEGDEITRANIKIADQTLDLLVSAIHDNNGEYSGTLVTWANITEKLALEDKTKAIMGESKAQAQELQELGVSLKQEGVCSTFSGHMEVPAEKDSSKLIGIGDWIRVCNSLSMASRRVWPGDSSSSSPGISI